MNKVNLGDKYTHRVTLRLNQQQYDFLIQVSELLGVSPSDYLRMTVNTGMMAFRNDMNDLVTGNGMKVVEGMVGTQDENVKTNSNNLI